MPARPNEKHGAANDEFAVTPNKYFRVTGFMFRLSSEGNTLEEENIVEDINENSEYVLVFGITVLLLISRKERIGNSTRV